MASAAPTFSYAQAAKGEASPVPSNTPGDAHMTPEPAEPTAAEQPSISNTTSENKASDGQLGLPVETIRPNVGETAQPTMSSTPAEVEGSSSIEGDHSKAQSALPDRSTMSHSTSTVASSGVAKDDTNAATPNESDSTWEKVSQVSQSDTKTPSKADSDNEDSKLSSWEHVPPEVQLKEAPLPAFNVWHKRAADAKVKVHDPKPINFTGSSTTPEHEALPNQKKPLDSPTESSIKKKALSPRQIPDDRAFTSNSQGLGSQVLPQPIAGKSVVAPPPSTDATLWPTLEGSKEDDKRKLTDKVERPDKSDSEKTPNKPHGKDKWVTMPYVPSAVFSTPLPTNRRGGRAARGGRDGNGRGASNGAASGGEKPHNGSPGGMTAQSGGNRGDMAPPRHGAASSKTKRASSAGPATSAEARRPGDDGTKAFPNNRGHPGEGRRVSSGQHNGSRQWSPSRRGPPSEADFAPRSNPHPQDGTHSRVTSDRRGDGPRSGADSNGFGSGRERGEGRPERGRGGYRGRGNFNNASGAHATGGQTFPPQSGGPPAYPPTKSQSYSDPRRESVPAGSFQTSRENRHYRNSSRSQSIPTSNFGRFPGGPQHLPQLHTDNANMFYPHAPPAVMSAAPYPGYMEHMQLHGLVQMQMEYYFSVDNLCKDMFLRKQMDSQGFVFLEVLQKFNRIKQLTQDGDLIRLVCSRSAVVELLTGGDGIDRLRRRGDWQQWVMPIEERDQSAQTDGPTQLHLPQPPLMHPFGDPKMVPANGPITPKSATYGSHFRPEPLNLGDSYQHSTTANESTSNTTPVTDTPLSAAVPDFTPSMHMGPPSVVQYTAMPPGAEPGANLGGAEFMMSPVKMQPTSGDGSNAGSNTQVFANGARKGPGTPEDPRSATQDDNETKSPANGKAVPSA